MGLRRGGGNRDDAYTVEVDAGEDDALILALTVVVEQMCMD